MIRKLGKYFSEGFKKNMPNSFVFALILTLVTALAALTWVDASFVEMADSWYQGFWLLLEFGMQMALILITGYSIALSNTAKKAMNFLARQLKTPALVYIFVILIGYLLALVSWGWLVITAVLGRELAMRVKGINYYYLIACVYFSGGIWVCGLSSSIPLLLNTPGNFLIESGIMGGTLGTGFTLGSSLNLAVAAVYVVVGPLLFYLLAPKETIDLSDLLEDKGGRELSIEEEAAAARLPEPALSDKLNNGWFFQYVIAALGLFYIGYYFWSRGLDLNLNIMIFVFLILGLFLHKTPMRYGIAMKHASANISGILFQYPFYAEIMGIMIYTGLGERLASVMASVATIDSYPFFAYLTGGVVNFAIPSAGGEFAVIGPSVLTAIKEIGTGLPADQLNLMMAKASLAVAYGETLTNLLQPFFLLIVLPVMGKGIKVQARDVMGYLIIPFIVIFSILAVVVGLVPV